MNKMSNTQVEEPRIRERRADELRGNAASSNAPPLHDNAHWLATTALLREGIGQRGHIPIRAAAMQNAQRTYGNRAVQRFLSQQTYAGEVEGKDLAERIDSKAGGGSPLPAAMLARLEEGLGADLSGVRVHTDAEADKMARSVNSIAFTTGQDIYFSSGAYSPDSNEGLRLLAHEATHTVQQSQGPVDGTASGGGVSISDPSDSFEQEAERTADAVMSRQSGERSRAESSASPPASSAGGPAVQRYRSPDMDWVTETANAGLAGTAGLFGSLPVVGNIFNAGMGVAELMGAGGLYAAGREKDARSSLHHAENNFINAIPVYGNMRSFNQGVHDQGALFQNLFGGGDKAPELSRDIFDRKSGAKMDSLLSSLF